jgi:DNA-directed RNA polymerase specialized sigma24 family protein
MKTCLSNGLPENSAVFDAWFSRCRPSLCFVARRVLGSHEGAEEAVQNCLLTASRNPPSFEDEGTFGSWLLRILIDEALLILRQRKSTFPNGFFSEFHCMYMQGNGNRKGE